jgi:hypothetical protein
MELENNLSLLTKAHGPLPVVSHKYPAVGTQPLRGALPLYFYHKVKQGIASRSQNSYMF